ncbi:MAG: ribosome biogenesis GTPase Der [Syntrophus sp. (in: bacteria)]|nr:ribosome biogenesis GTPase Der [Syntrophus sp. (in: bacteria)]
MKPIISIVGRPNVGKSTLFNRLIGYKKAITEDIPGVTRDRNYGEFEYSGKDFTLVDTGGFEPSKDEGYFPLVKKQIEISMEESAMIIFVLDGRDGMLPQDVEILDILRKYEKPLFFVVNKIDSQKKELDTPEFYALGVERFYSLSALHGRGLEDLLEDMVKQGRLMEKEGGEGDEGEEEEIEKGIRIAMVGRPNTGKSSIINRLLGSERMIVSDMAGTTRDAIDSVIDYKGREITLIDTAGLRRKSKVLGKIEGYSVASALRTIERATVVNLVIDAEEGISHQDASIAHLIVTQGKGICVVVNKWDLIRDSMSEGEYRRMTLESIPHADFAPVIFTSAKTGANIRKIMETDIKVYGQLTTRIETGRLNKTFQAISQKLHPSRQRNAEVKINYVNQAKSMPPTFILFSNHPELIQEHYKRYIENSLRVKYGFEGAPIRLVFKKKS